MVSANMLIMVSANRLIKVTANVLIMVSANRLIKVTANVGYLLWLVLTC